MPDHAALHGPHAPLLRAALAAASPPGARAALDLACGAGAKTAWLAACAAPGALVLGLDLDVAALRAAPLEPIADWQIAACSLPPQQHAAQPGLYGSTNTRNALGEWVAADAHRLPLRPASFDLIWCVAALGLFAAPERALAEARRALRPGGALVVATAGERWVRPRRWPPALQEAFPAWLPSAPETFPATPPPGPETFPARCPAGALPPADDLGADLRDLLAAAGLREARLAAYLLDPPGLAPAAALLPLLGWEALRPLAAASLDPAAFAACEVTAAEEPEPLPVLLVARSEK